MYRVFFAFVLSIVALPLGLNHAKAIEVYFFKGAGDFSFINKHMQFSGGLDRIADQLNREGIHAEVYRHGAAAAASRTIHRRMPDSVAFVGHSLGALTAMRMARKMREEGIRVAYVATLDIPSFSATAGNNVEWAENYHSLAPHWGKLKNVDTHPKAKNINVLASHTTIDNSTTVQNGVLTAIRNIAAAEHTTIESILAAEFAPSAVWTLFGDREQHP